MDTLKKSHLSLVEEKVEKPARYSPIFLVPALCCSILIGVILIASANQHLNMSLQPKTTTVVTTTMVTTTTATTSEVTITTTDMATKKMKSEKPKTVIEKMTTQVRSRIGDMLYPPSGKLVSNYYII